jgi:hypothetical protein
MTTRAAYATQMNNPTGCQKTRLFVLVLAVSRMMLPALRQAPSSPSAEHALLQAFARLQAVYTCENQTTNRSMALRSCGGSVRHPFFLVSEMRPITLLQYA